MTLTTGAYHSSADWPEIEAVPGVFRRVLTCGDQMMVVQFLIKADAEASVKETGGGPLIPKKYNSYAVFAFTGMLLFVLVWAGSTVWTDIRALLVPKPAEVVDGSTKFDGEL